MEKKMVLREYQAGDAPFLEDIIRATWSYDRFCSPRTAKRMARIYLSHCLSRQTYTQVAVLDGVPAGIIMGRDKRIGAARRFCARCTFAELMMLSCREGRTVLKAFSEVDAVDEMLLKKRGKQYDGELVFFAVHENCRGTGIGKALFEKFSAYIKSQKIKDFYLYTDSSCNYGFYEHQGMVRCGEEAFSVAIGIENSMRFYLYEYENVM